MAIFCITTSNPEFQKLLAESGEKQGVFAMMVSKWMTENEVYDRYPTLQELGISPIKSVDNINYQLSSDMTTEEFIASEKTIRDLAARMSDRIGMSVRFESDRTKEYKGKLKNNTAYINLAYATLDTPIHEILGHPIIRAIKNKQNVTKRQQFNFNKTFFNNQDIKNDTGKTVTHEGHIYKVYELKKFSNVVYKAINFERNEEIHLSEEEFNDINNESQLYKNLLKELEYGKGKEVLDRIKRDYKYKVTAQLIIDRFGRYGIKQGNSEEFVFDTKEEAEEQIKKINSKEYTLEEQQEEAIVELLGLYTAGRLDKVKDGKLISLLKRLLKEMKAFMKQLLGQKEVKIDELPDNMTIGDLADLLAYSNSKLILPGNEVIYTTPDNQQFKTYQEASNHISRLAKSVENVDLDNVKVNRKLTNINQITENEFLDAEGFRYFKDNGKWYSKYDVNKETPLSDNLILSAYNTKDYSYSISDESQEINVTGKHIEDFIEKNKEYEQSKEIIDEWKRVNNIQYNSEEIYSRGQEFVSVVGAYSNFDVNLMMQNLLSHIEDNEKAGGKFAISAFTKPVDKSIGHLEGGGGKIKFKIYPKSEDILWAANTDVYSGSVWDASEKVSKGKQSELLGVSYSKYPSLRNINAVQPNLANIVDNLAHHHNELGITLTGNNFRLEYDEDIPYTTKKIIDSVNSILDQKYGKLVKPEINKSFWRKTRGFKVGSPVLYKGSEWEIYSIKEQGIYKYYTLIDRKNTGTIQSNIKRDELEELSGYEGIQPTQTKETLKESIESIRNKVIRNKDKYVIQQHDNKFVIYDIEEQDAIDIFDNKESALQEINKLNNQIDLKEKEYTSQALINTKIAKLKEVAKKYPRSLIRSEVKPISNGLPITQWGEDELPFQKIPGIISQTGLDMSNAEARAFNSLVNDGTISIKCE